ncbi:MAG: 4Fe-4S dicluster domain-containing protein [Treponema sp.]|nr:4Fe-4S dicluster domain-containing protein [Treponema sp.]
MYSINEEKIYDLFNKIRNLKDLYIPVTNESGKANFVKYEDGLKLTSELKTVRSAKDFFFPKTECLVKYIKEGKSFKVEQPDMQMKDFVLFGVRACDAASFDVIDNVYIKQQPVDTYYKNRREHSTVFVLACNEPYKTCFCSAYKIDASLSQNVTGADVLVWNKDGKYYLKGVTEKGNKILSENTELLNEEDDSSVDEIQREIKDKIQKLPLSDLNLSNIEKLKTLDMFNSKNWDKVCQSCLGCGTCTYVCPTCMCFDVRDFDNGKKIEQVRCWDSCMYSDFTQMAGANPRTSQKERSRQRFMHKLKYYPDVYGGKYACVGCGRCLESCPVNMNIVKVIKMFEKDE